MRCANHGSRASHSTEFGGSRDSEIGDLECAILSKQDILRFYIPVGDAALMCYLEPLANLVRQVDGAIDWEPALGFDEIMKGQWQVLHGHEVLAINFTHLSNANYVGMIEGGCNLCLPLKTFYVGSITA